MEQISPDGQRREVDPAMLAQFDQMEAQFNEMTNEIIRLRLNIQMAAHDGNMAAVVELTREMDALVRKHMPQAQGPEINYIMYLINLVEQAKVWTEYVFNIVNLSVRTLGSLTMPDHPLKALPNFDQETLQKEVDVMLNALEDHYNDEDPAPDSDPQNTYTTTTGVKLHKVHAPEVCQGTFCVVHNPAPGPWHSWDVHWREDWRLMVRICPHAVEHVAMEEMLRMPLLGLIAHDHPQDCGCACDLSRCTTITDDEGHILGFQAND